MEKIFQKSCNLSLFWYMIKESVGKGAKYGLEKN